MVDVWVTDYHLGFVAMHMHTNSTSLHVRYSGGSIMVAEIMYAKW